MNLEVNLTKRVQTPYGWRYCRLVFSAKGRIKPDLAVVNGKQECHTEGAYYLEWREGVKRRLRRFFTAALGSQLPKECGNFQARSAYPE
jgi:hypothetical protein